MASYDLFFQDKEYKSYKLFGGEFANKNGINGGEFSIFAPKALEVSVVGDFNNWDKDRNKLIKVHENGVWNGFTPDIKLGDLYKYSIKTRFGKDILKSDPFALWSEKRPNNASILYKDEYKWKDYKWIRKRKLKDFRNLPINIYEVHLGSFKRGKNGEFLTYKEISKILPRYVKSMGYTHVELMPVMEHCCDESWGYLISGYYSINSRHGTPRDFKNLIDEFHKLNIGVILDWVPGHFCRDIHGLYRLDGTSVFEYEDKLKGENSTWGSGNFDFTKREVCNFLISNAFYFIEEFHIDGFRVDSVSNIINLDNEKEPWQWISNERGGSERLEGIELLKELNTAIDKFHKDIIVIAEDSSVYEGVTKGVDLEGLGFTFKWNMGWMNDSLKYLELNEENLSENHNLLNFAMMYNYSENFILPLSHDEVVHGKKSIIGRIQGDYHKKFSLLKTFYGFMYTHPGKKTVFMGNEIAQFEEWKYDDEVEWELLNYESHEKFNDYIKELNYLYRRERSLWINDYKEIGFKWMEPNNKEQSIYIYGRYGVHNSEFLAVVCNFKGNYYKEYKIGVPFKGRYKEVFNSNLEKFGGNLKEEENIKCSKEGKWQDESHNIDIEVFPYSMVIYKFME